MRREVVTFIEAQCREEQATLAEAEASRELALADDAFEVAWAACLTAPKAQQEVSDA